MTGIQVRPDEGECFAMVDGDHVVKAVVRDSHGAFEVFEVRARSGAVTPPHVSPWSGVVYVLEGGATVRVGDESAEIGPGAVVTLPAGTPCSMSYGADGARFVAVTTGDLAGRFFADAARSVPVDRPVPEVIPQLREVTARHGVRMG